MEDFSTRIKLIRHSLGMTREEFATALNFPEITLRSWEYRKVAPHQTSLQKLIQNISKTGLSVTKEWLMEGTGIGPFGLKASQLSNISERDIFIASNPGSIVIDITHNKYFPYFKKGDLVGAIPCVHPQHFDLVVIYSKVGKLDIRRVYISEEECVLLMPLNQLLDKPVFYKEEHMKLYVISFIKVFYSPNK